MKDYKTAVYIGRFQPLHNDHIEVVKLGLEIADRVIVIIGSASGAKTIKNPFSFEERKAMFQKTFDEYGYHKVIVKGVRDYYYNDNAWLSNIQAITDVYVSEGDSVALLGSYKDSTSSYLSWFPHWDFVTQKTGDTNSTDIRNALFDQKIRTDWQGLPVGHSFPENLPVNHVVSSMLKTWIDTKTYAELNKEYHFIKEYKKSWEAAPFPPTFVTTDAVVVCSGHILVIERKFNPGKGLFALPGGFVKQNETIKSAALRELKEETGIRVDKIILDSSIKEYKVFDHPDRSLRGRTISHGFYIHLKDGRLPEIKGNDDASNAIWMPIWDVNKNEHRFFEDHTHIINYFLGV